MKLLRNIALALLFGAVFSVSAFADGKPNQGGNGGPSAGDFGKNTHYGLSDSCWNVFVSQLSASDAAKLASDQATLTANQTQIDTLNNQIGRLLRGGNVRDSATRAQIKNLESQIETLQKANGAAQMDIDSILKTNGTLFSTIAENCGRHINPRDTAHRDTVKGGGGPGGNGNPPNTGGKGQFGLSDSCWKIFLTQITTADQTQLAADQTTIATNEAQIDSLFKQIRTLLKGGAKDSVTRAEVKALENQIKTLMTSSGNALKDYASIIKKNETALQSIRQGCGRPVHKGTAGGPGNGLTVSDIIPNPATAGSTVSISITLTADANVMISIGSAIAQGPPVKIVFNGLLTAGIHPETIDLTGFGAGVYLVNIESGSQMITKKLVIQ